jgi:hypothetical protein
MQLVAVKKDLHEDPNKANDTVYTSGNKHRQLVQALTAGLKPYGLALAIATVVWLLTTLITPAYGASLSPLRPSRSLSENTTHPRPYHCFWSTCACRAGGACVSCRVVSCAQVFRVSLPVQGLFDSGSLLRFLGSLAVGRCVPCDHISRTHHPAFGRTAGWWLTHVATP